MTDLWDSDEGWEHATIKRDDGTPIVRTSARRAFERFKRAVAQAGGRPPMDGAGVPMLWNEGRGWFPRSAAADHPRPRTLAELDGKQRLVNASIRQERVDVETAEERALIAAAFARPIIWNFARSFAAGTPWPGSDADEVQRIAFRLARRGWAKPSDIPAVWNKDFLGV